jgi:hypothetical protein
MQVREQVFNLRDQEDSRKKEEEIESDIAEYADEPAA